MARARPFRFLGRDFVAKILACMVFIGSGGVLSRLPQCFKGPSVAYHSLKNFARCKDNDYGFSGGSQVHVLRTYHAQQEEVTSYSV